MWLLVPISSPLNEKVLPVTATTAKCAQKEATGETPAPHPMVPRLYPGHLFWCEVADLIRSGSLRGRRARAGSSSVTSIHCSTASYRNR
jgi:hypothetical protein